MIKINTDAAFRQKTKEAGLGINIRYQDQQILLKYYIKEINDNHLAEFLALNQALSYLLNNQWASEIVTIQSDSQILVQSIEKEYAQNKLYQEILNDTLNLLAQFKAYYIKWIPEKQNNGADHLAKQALHQQGKYEIL